MSRSPFSLSPFPVRLKRLPPRMRHLAFYEMLSSTDTSSKLWRVVAATLHTLRLVDTWRRGSRRRSKVSTRQVRAVTGLVKAAQGGARRQLPPVIDAIESNAPDAEAAIATALLRHARALYLQMHWQLAIDVCETITVRLGRHIDETLLLGDRRSMGVDREWRLWGNSDTKVSNQP